jgi:3-oxoacyl-[acyl-carrier-protein] synthase-3
MLNIDSYSGTPGLIILTQDDFDHLSKKKNEGILNKTPKVKIYSMKKTAVICDIASYLPERVLSNADLEKLVDTSDEWILTRTGIRERRIAASDEYASSMGIKAAKNLFDKSSIRASDVELVIAATMTPDYLCPCTASLIQHGIGASHAAAFDIEAACSGFVYGLSVAKAFIESGMYSTILLVATEKNSAFIDYTDRNTCVLFGDGAGAALIRQGGTGLAVRSIHLEASGEEADLIKIPAGGSRLPASPTSFAEKQHSLKMNGKEVFKHAVRRMEEAMRICLESASLTPADIRWLVPHQANLRIIDALSKRFDIPKEKVVITLDRFANTSASTIPIALDLLQQEGKIQPADLLMLTAIGGGLTWGAAVLEAI